MAPAIALAWLYCRHLFGPGANLAVEPVEAGPIQGPGILGLLHLSYVWLKHLIATSQGRLPTHNERLQRNQTRWKDRSGGRETRGQLGGGLALIFGPIGEV